ncbi:MAG: IS110 family transposase [Halopseudomonas sp.]
METITVVGLDLAKSVFQIHGADIRGNCVIRKTIKRNKLLSFFAQLPRCLVGMEACSSSHYWGRSIRALGHEVKLIAPQYVKPYVKTNKNDAADAEAICEAVSRPSMRFVGLKTVDQQAVLLIHRERDGIVKERTALINRLRATCAEFGIVIPAGRQRLTAWFQREYGNQESCLPELLQRHVGRMRDRLRSLELWIDELDQEIDQQSANNEACKRLSEVPGIGRLTASALVASIGNGREFKNGRQLSAWLGLVPRQHSSGGKPLLLGISKRGDCYLRCLLIHGARAVLKHMNPKRSVTRWLEELTKRRHKNVVIVAMANKLARIAWALLSKGERYRESVVA